MAKLPILVNLRRAIESIQEDGPQGIMSLIEVAEREGGGDECIADDERLAGYWIEIYRGFIGYLAGKNEVDMAHLEAIESMETVAEQFMERLNSRGRLERAAGGICELDNALGIMIEKEYGRIEQELEKKKELLQEKMEEYSLIKNSGERLYNLELVLGGVDELVKMEKLAGGELESKIELRDAVLEKISHAKALQRVEKAGRGKLELYADLGEEISKDPIYNDIVGRALKRIGKISMQSDEKGILGSAEVKSIFEVRDSCYDSLAAMGIKGPAEEIEEKICEVEKENVGLIDGFIRQNIRGRVSRSAGRKAEEYMEAVGAWKRYS